MKIKRAVPLPFRPQYLINKLYVLVGKNTLLEHICHETSVSPVWYVVDLSVLPFTLWTLLSSQDKKCNGLTRHNDRSLSLVRP